MARPKKIPEAPQEATAAEGEGVHAPMVVPDAGATAGEEASPAPLITEPDAAVVENPVFNASDWTVIVHALQPSRWRIGRHFTPEPVLIPGDALTEAEANALRADPLLVVTAVKDI